MSGPAATFGGEPVLGVGASSGLLSGPLVVLNSPMEAEEAKAAEEARRNSPEAARAREESQTKYEGLSSGQAGKVDGKAFPVVVNDSAGGPPSLPSGEQIVRYEATNAAAITLPGGKYGVVESLGPIATRSGHGQFKPIDLALQSTGAGFAPVNSDVAVQISKHASGGVIMPGDGVSLTPVNAQGQVLGGSEGVLEGASVVYANTQMDTDTLAKPVTGGFEIDSLLRSVNSPTTLYFRVGMPTGAELVNDKGPGGGARVVLDGQTVAGIAPVSAQDAAGTSVPVQMSMSGDTLIVTVKLGAGEYAYPISVDPRAYDYTIQLPSACKGYSGERTNWEFASSNGAFECYSSGSGAGYGVVMTTVGTVYAGEFDELLYPAHGEAQVTFVEGEMQAAASSSSGSIAKIEFLHGAGAEKVVEREFKLTNAGESFARKLEHECDQSVIEEGVQHCRALHNSNELRISQTDTAKENVAEGYGFWFQLYNGTWTSVYQEKAPEVMFNTESPYIEHAENRTNVLHGEGGWLSKSSGAVEVRAFNFGLGVSDVKIRDLTAGIHGEHWEYNDPTYADGLCTGVWCNQIFETTADPNGTYFTYNKEMAEGANTFELCAENTAYMKTCTTATIDVDNTPPREVKLIGLASEGAEISATQHKITVEATDGMTPTPSSGIKSIQVFVDGREIGQPSGFCSPGECTAKGTWTIDGEDLGSGEHKLRMVATDNAGNGLEKEITFAIRDATPVKIGPGTVDPVTGQFSLSASDVDIAGAGSVSRTYGSRSLTAGVESPLGPQWKLSAGAGMSLQIAPNGYAELTSVNGRLTIFAKNKEGNFEAPKGDENLKLEFKEKEYLLSDPAAGTMIRFTLPSGSNIWAPTKSEGPAAGATVAYAYRSVKVGEAIVIEPIEELGPVASGVTCGKNPAEVSQSELQARLEELKPGCRVLSFTYAEKTTAGEGASEWGEYNGRLVKVSLTAYNSAASSKKMETTVVAQYVYDKQGRLRAEWDPRIEKSVGCGGSCSPLKTTYGYDAEGHVTALTLAGQQPWVFTYGTGSNDPSTGRLLKVTRVHPKAGESEEEIKKKLAEQTASPKNTEVPKMTGVPLPGVTMGVSTGKWSPEQVSYSYQWEECNSEAKECTPVLGATNANYTVAPSDTEHRLVAVVTATAGGGSEVAVTSASAEVRAAENEYSIGSEDPEVLTVGPDGNLWFTKYSSIGKITPSGTVTEYSLPEGGSVLGITSGSDGNLWFTEYSRNKIGKITPSGMVTEYSLPEGSGPGGITLGPDKNVWFTEEKSNKIAKITTSGSVTEYSRSTGKYATEITTGPDGNLWFTDTQNSGIGKITTSGSITEYPLPKGSGPWHITAGPDSNMWFTDYYASKIGKITTSGTISEYSFPPGSPVDIISGPEEDLWFTTLNNMMGRITTSGSIEEYALPVGSDPHGIAEGPEGKVWFAGVGIIGKLNPHPTGDNGEHYNPGPGSTIEYGVPLSGINAPYQMTGGEMAKWGQTKDLPKEATAIFPPDEPQGWPASSYKRATILYMDEHARTTNTASPSGAISTVEYNTLNEVTRELSANARATAMKEGCESETKCKSAEVAGKLNSENRYNGETQAEKELEEKEGKREPGVRLLEKVGPEHKIRLSNGTEEETRDRKAYSYNEGAPSKGEVYKLLTKSHSWVESVSTNKELEGTGHEFVNIYSNQTQGELGWKLRKPLATSETVAGKTTTTSTEYSPETGVPLESSSATTSAAPVYSGQFGSKGLEAGQFESIGLDAVAQSSGYVWVVDGGSSRIEEFNKRGEYLNLFGSKGAGADQFNAPFGVAVSPMSGDVYVTDRLNYRVDELSSSGSFVRAFGWGVVDGKAEFEICTATTKCQVGLKGNGSGQFGSGEYGSLGGVTVDSSGHVWVVDEGNDRVEEFSENGEYLGQFGQAGDGKGQFEGPVAITYDDSELYVTDTGNHRVDKFSLNGASLGSFGSFGTGNGQFKKPYGIAADPISGELFVTDVEGNRAEGFSRAGSFLWSFGSTGKGTGEFEEPVGVAVSTSGAAYLGNDRAYSVQEWQRSAGTPSAITQFGTKGTGNGQFSEPRAVAFTKNGNLYVLDTSNSRVEEFSSSGAYLEHFFGSVGKEAGQLNTPYAFTVDSNGNTWIADTGNNRVDEFNEKREFVEAFGFGVVDGTEKLETCTTSCRAGIAGAGTGQLKEPKGIAVTSSGYVYVADSPNNRIEEFNEKGEFVKAFGFGVSTPGSETFQICTSACKAGTSGSGEGQFNGPRAITIAQNGMIWVVDQNNNRVEEFNKKAEYVAQIGTKGTGHGQLKEPRGLAIDTAGNLWVADSGNNRIQELTPAGSYLTSFADKGTAGSQLTEPWGLTITSAGSIYVADTKNNRITQWTVAPRPGNEGATDTHTIYYSAAANAEYEECGKHPEWANLVCRTEPDAQPGDNGPPSLPVTTTTYNMWDEPETVVEKIGSVTRTTKKTYDSAGRLAGSEKTSTSSEDATLPAVTDEYSTETGAMTKVSETLEGKAKTVTSAYNTLGQLVSYTDGEGAMTKYAYDVDGRVEEVSEPMGRQIYAYDTTTGFLTKLLDTAAGTFTATYGVAGEMLSENYPNGIAAKYTYDTIGQTTNLEYEKTTHCTEKCVWFSDADAFGSGGEPLSQTSTLSSEAYSYNEEGQLTQTQETPVGGKGCITRAYGYSEEGERTSLTTREPNEKGECTNEGGVVEGHAYDVVGRLLDPGVTYDALGNMTKVPALDAGGQAITSSFYVDNQLATQEQAGKKLVYSYDPAGRTLLAKKGKSLTFFHYAGPGEALTWTCEEEEGKKECEEQKATKWTRNIPGIDGALTAIQTNGETPVLQLHDLEGNIVATVADSETATGLEKLYNSTEFGVPSGGKAPKYGWLGASEAESELETGVITQAGSTYVPQLARTVQTEVVEPPGAAPNGVMATEAYVPPELPWSKQAGNEAAANTIAQQRTVEREAQEKACLASPLACEIEDPSNHYRAWEAKVKAKEIDKFVAAGDLTKLFGTVFGTLADWVDGYIESHFVTATIFDWMEEYGLFLEACIRELHGRKDSHGGCQADFSQILGVVPDFFVKPTIYYCLLGESNKKSINNLALYECTRLAWKSEVNPWEEVQ